jgi:t-SNARE complex subunit (syntaxin)
VEKAHEVDEIAAEIGEIEQLGHDVAHAVAGQSERVDVVVENIEESLDVVRTGNDSIIKAAELQRAARRKMCCMIMILVAVLGVILGPTLAKVSGAF